MSFVACRETDRPGPVFPANPPVILGLDPRICRAGDPRVKPEDDGEAFAAEDPRVRPEDDIHHHPKRKAA
ncbi:hypothetical protein SAMN05443999_103285 [Roseovarius azorensis]|uniref:Uncharacterized protein n=1 Tax=Roseovarius azorensis TaxID=1287727 RepID=A0A1H7MDW4_9RHOB|nr:hypothetical protein SAMN05443999_103285 [Roseovarius azorensis]